MCQRLRGIDVEQLAVAAIQQCESVDRTKDCARALVPFKPHPVLQGSNRYQGWHSGVSFRITAPGRLTGFDQSAQQVTRDQWHVGEHEQDPSSAPTPGGPGSADDRSAHAFAGAGIADNLTRDEIRCRIPRNPHQRQLHRLRRLQRPLPQRLPCTGLRQFVRPKAAGAACSEQGNHNIGWAAHGPY